jgi:hypothetical protein
MRELTRIICSVATACLMASAADNSLGTWKLNVSKSSYGGAPMPVKNLVMIRQASANGVKVSQIGERVDGTKLNSSYTTRYDGKECVVEGTSPFDTISVTQVDANTFVDERKKSGGLFHAKVRTLISEDGKTLTTVASGTNAEGKQFTSTLVHERQ